MSVIAPMQAIGDHTPISKWKGAPLESFRQVANTNRGDIGEDFIVRYLQQFDIAVQTSGSRTMAWDLQIADKRFEIKTASEDTGGSFQFNHVRLDRDYDYLLCLGIRPAAIVFDAWRKGDVSEKAAGTLVRMAEGQGVTFKLTKKPDSMRNIEDLPDWVRQEIRPPEAD